LTMDSIEVTPAGVRSFKASGPRLHHTYKMQLGQWVTVTDPADLEYLLNPISGVVLRERPELGLRYFQCVAPNGAKLVLPGEDPGGVCYGYGEVVIGGGVLHRVLCHDGRFEPIRAARLLAKVPSLRVLVVRGGGFGDLFLTLPAIATLRNRFPDMEIHYATAAPLKRLLQHNDLLNGVSTLFEAYEAAPFGLVVDLGRWAEGAPDSGEVHRSDIFAHAFGIETVDSYRFSYTVMPEERAEAQKVLGGGPDVIGLQLTGSINRRCPPIEWGEKMMQMLLALGWRVAVFAGDRLDWAMPGVINLTGLKDAGLTMAVIEQCTGLVAGDSGILHGANALGRPVVGLFGPVDPDLRVRDHPNCRVVAGNEAAHCLPCNDHQDHQCKGYPPCMTRLDHGDVLDALEATIDGCE